MYLFVFGTSNSQTMPIDTLKASKRLQEEGTFSSEQAERIAEILSDLDVASATKDDLDDLENRLGGRIDQVDARIEQLESRVDQAEEHLGTRIDEVEARLTQRIEVSEQRTEQQISQLRSDLYRALLIGFGAVAALVSVLNFIIG